MYNQKKLIVSHAPFIHDGGRIPARSYHTMLAALPAVIFGILQYGMPALAVVCLSVSSALLWEILINLVSKSKKTIGDGNAALLGLIFAMLLPATASWWFVLVGTLLVIVLGKQIYGGIGGFPFNHPALAVLILAVSWPQYLDFDGMLLNYQLGFPMIYPLGALKAFGVSSIYGFTPGSLLMGQQIGGLGSTFGLGLIAGGVYLIIRGIIRWEISVSFLVGIFVTAFIFNAVDSTKYAGPIFHLFSGYTLIGAFFLATEDSSSPVNFLPMILYGLIGGLMAVLIRNIGAYADGVLFAIIIVNILNPLLDKIRPKAIGKVE